MGAPDRVVITETAADLLARLVARHGPVMFHQSGGCCDGSAPMCYPDGGAPVWICCASPGMQLVSSGPLPMVSM